MTTEQKILNRLSTLQTLRRLIDDTYEDVIDAMIDADIENMRNLDPHHNHAVCVGVTANGELDISTVTVRSPGYPGAYGDADWIVYVSNCSGDDLMLWVVESEEMQLPDDCDVPDYDERREAIIERALTDYAEVERSPYADDLQNVLKELDEEIGRVPVFCLRRCAALIVGENPAFGFNPNHLVTRQEGEAMFNNWHELLVNGKYGFDVFDDMFVFYGVKGGSWISDEFLEDECW